MASHGLGQSLPERVGQQDAKIEALTREVEQLRKLVANAHEAEEILRRAHRGESALEPMRMAPPRRNGHRRQRDGDVTYLRVVKVAAIGCLAASVIGGIVIPASSIAVNPAPASAATSFAGLAQDHVDAAEAGLCHGQLPQVGEWPGSDALVGSRRPPFGVVAFGGDAARAVAGGWCDAWPRP